MRSVISDAHVAGNDGYRFFPPCAAETLRGFSCLQVLYFIFAAPRRGGVSSAAFKIMLTLFTVSEYFPTECNTLKHHRMTELSKAVFYN
jgi:hypothetical protein